MSKKYPVQVNKKLPSEKEHILGMFPSTFRKSNGIKNQNAEFVVKMVIKFFISKIRLIIYFFTVNFYTKTLKVRYNYSNIQEETEDSSKIDVQEKIDGEKTRHYTAPNIHFEGKWAVLVKNGDELTLVPLHKKLKFAQLLQDKVVIDQEDKIKNTLILMKNGKIRQKIETKTEKTIKQFKQEQKDREEEEKSDNGKIWLILYKLYRSRICWVKKSKYLSMLFEK